MVFTNFLNVYSLQALEEVLKEYEGTVLLISHGRRFINEVANGVIILENQKAIAFDGNYEQYKEKEENDKKWNGADAKVKQMLLENRLAEIMGKLSAPPKGVDMDALNKEYHMVLRMLKEARGG